MKQGILCITFLYQQHNLLINQGGIINNRGIKCREIAATNAEQHSEKKEY
ncbi:not available [Yersinia enterocolitica]|nr:not available [Yersinia enterocolitica]